jgi:starch synthase
LKRHKILFISTEVSPFVKTNILADFSYQLPLALRELGHEVRVMMPKYKSINERKFILRDVIRLKEIGIPVGDEEKKISVKSAFLPNSKVQIYFLDYKPYFNRNGLYINEKKKGDFSDNANRFVLFSKGILETLKLLCWQPNIIHCNDWQTGLIPLYLKTIYKNDKFFCKTSSVFTIHNFHEPGCFERNLLEKAGLIDDKNYDEKCTEFNGQFSFLKAGIIFSDYITTNSENYVKQFEEIYKSLNDFTNLLKNRKDKIVNIIQGVDYSTWNPEIDKNITMEYNLKTIHNKNESKISLLTKVGLPLKPDFLLLGWIYNKNDSEFFNVLGNVVKYFKNLNIQIVVVGKIDKKGIINLKKYKEHYSKNFSFYSTDDAKFIHIIIAGCDVLLLPFLFYHEDFNPIHCLNYGTVPVIRNIGEFSDMIIEFHKNSMTGNGFIIKNYSSEEIVQKLEYISKLFQNESIWRIIQKNGMKEEFLWENNAKKYIKVYSSALKMQK